MPRPRTGTVETYTWRDGRTVTFRARVWAYGQRWRVDLGTNHEGWNDRRAENEVERIVAMIERGTWEPPGAAPAAPVDETFHVFASRWWMDKKPTLRESTRSDYEWRLSILLKHFHRQPVSTFTVQDVDQYRAALVRDGKLSARSVNMTLDVLAMVLDRAVEYDLLAQNPARGRNRRLPLPRRQRPFLEADQLVELLELARAWEDRLPDHQRYGRRTLLATLALAGVRVSELTALRRGDLDLPGGRLRVVDAKTPAGARDVELTAHLHDLLSDHVAVMRALGRPTGSRAPLFPTYTGGTHNASNIRTRLLQKLTADANENRDGLLLPAVTPHGLRRTFVSLALTHGRDPRWVMAQIGHTDARLTLQVYAQVMQRQRVDSELVASLMRFPGEAESGEFRPANSPTSVRRPA